MVRRILLAALGAVLAVIVACSGYLIGLAHSGVLEDSRIPLEITDCSTQLPTI